ncbi:hypothetical protein AOA14_07315 [Sphingopyxis terrae subsp. terrae NBRC 15098]|uniref:Uncharacterized protein n=1 Tax=Sphingopyxis terrae subsp. terrae NBRC 15098 TaxID=1219058 RepID=A0A142VYR0_9SPHN|nr:hypothetical protein AOA14_07315 [Sphingopyxis terrae subsp. terrae NBRC 15098]
MEARWRDAFLTRPYPLSVPFRHIDGQFTRALPSCSVNLVADLLALLIGLCRLQAAPELGSLLIAKHRHHHIARAVSIAGPSAAAGAKRRIDTHLARALLDRLSMPGTNALSLLGGCCRAHLLAELRALGACQQAEARELVVDGLRRVQPVAILVPVAGSILVAQAIPIVVHIGPVLVTAFSRRAQAVARKVEIAAGYRRSGCIRPCARSALGMGRARDHAE